MRHRGTLRAIANLIFPRPIALNREFSRKTRFLRPGMYEYLSKKLGKMRTYLEQTDSLIANIDKQLENMKIWRGY
ncbi:hypothetical protein QT997_01725 [Microcoleus sp. S11D4]|uniref:hypothetical protein n=1 Tax=Microcoleus sp. S1D4 TaxID=3055413 RepID=UPI002FD068AB